MRKRRSCEREEPDQESDLGDPDVDHDDPLEQRDAHPLADVALVLGAHAAQPSRPTFGARSSDELVVDIVQPRQGKRKREHEHAEHDDGQSHSSHAQPAFANDLPGFLVDPSAVSPK